jgi:hypothetical protein
MAPLWCRSTSWRSMAWTMLAVTCEPRLAGLLLLRPRQQITASAPSTAPGSSTSPWTTLKQGAGERDWELRTKAVTPKPRARASATTSRPVRPLAPNTSKRQTLTGPW